MILSPGDKILICHRRLFPDDHPRFFVGVVDAYEAGMARVTGYTWLRDILGGVFNKKQDPRTKIVALLSGTLICYQLPQKVELSEIRIEMKENRVVLSDHGSYRLDLSESQQAKASGRRP